VADRDLFSQKGFEPAIERDNRGVCRNLAQTRSPQGEWTAWAGGQSYQNCGLECCRQIINRVREGRREPPVSQEELLALAIKGDLLATSPPAGVGAAILPTEYAPLGGTYAWQWQQILHLFTIASTMIRPLPVGSDDSRQFDLFRRVVVPALVARKGCILPVWASVLWPMEDANAEGWIHGRAGGGSHAVVPFAIAGGRVLLNDTAGPAWCGRIVDADLLCSSLNLTQPVLVTDDPLWA